MMRVAGGMAYSSFGAPVGKDARGRFTKLAPQIERQIEFRAKMAYAEGIAKTREVLERKLYEEHFGEAAVQLRCHLCKTGEAQVGWRGGRLVHRLKYPPQDAVHWDSSMPGEYVYHPCPDWDAEARHVSEPMGFFTFAWWPVRCRNGKLRWLKWVERHTATNGEITFTRGNRAH